MPRNMAEAVAKTEPSIGSVIVRAGTPVGLTDGEGVEVVDSGELFCEFAR